MPTNARTLEQNLNVNVRANYENDRLWRAAFRKSGVSAQNRLVERHDAKYGAYWKSYDFASNLEEANLFRYPLGPVFSGAKNLAAFRHDGGEIIYNLPNHLQAYLLVKSDDSRIDEGPVGIVSDPNQYSGSFAIVNGISCMGCHRTGMISFTDTLRATFNKKSGQSVADKVLRLFPAAEDMERLVSGDTERFQAALEKATGPFLRSGPDDKRDMTKFPEPITRAARDYDQPLTVADVARELGLPQSDELATKLDLPQAKELATVIKVSDVMRKLNLSPLATGETIPRDIWERAYQRTARELKLGIPIEF